MFNRVRSRFVRRKDDVHHLLLREDVVQLSQPHGEITAQLGEYREVGRQSEQKLLHQVNLPLIAH
jgi:hypothetical protein